MLSMQSVNIMDMSGTCVAQRPNINSCIRELSVIGEITGLYLTSTGLQVAVVGSLFAEAVLAKLPDLVISEAVCALIAFDDVISSCMTLQIANAEDIIAIFIFICSLRRSFSQTISELLNTGLSQRQKHNLSVLANDEILKLILSNPEDSKVGTYAALVQQYMENGKAAGETATAVISGATAHSTYTTGHLDTSAAALHAQNVVTPQPPHSEVLATSNLSAPVLVNQVGSRPASDNKEEFAKALLEQLMTRRVAGVTEKCDMDAAMCDMSADASATYAEALESYRHRQTRRQSLGTSEGIRAVQEVAAKMMAAAPAQPQPTQPTQPTTSTGPLASTTVAVDSMGSTWLPTSTEMLGSNTTGTVTDSVSSNQSVQDMIAVTQGLMTQWMMGSDSMTTGMQPHAHQIHTATTAPIQMSTTVPHIPPARLDEALVMPLDTVPDINEAPSDDDKGKVSFVQMTIAQDSKNRTKATRVKSAKKASTKKRKNAVVSQNKKWLADRRDKFFKLYESGLQPAEDTSDVVPGQGYDHHQM
eukprot:GFYU01003463.1.p1 GENE.GFYU01003463.1~~GFYU01003463.1.p1  ORF type:complete len:531 (-),score=112.42 GFYU01003463.1:368-1960(-)